MHKIKSARSWEETRAARAQGTKCGQKATDKRMAATHMLLAMGICPRDACMSAALKKAWLMSEIASVTHHLCSVGPARGALWHILETDHTKQRLRENHLAIKMCGVGVGGGGTCSASKQRAAEDRQAAQWL